MVSPNTITDIHGAIKAAAIAAKSFNQTFGGEDRARISGWKRGCPSNGNWCRESTEEKTETLELMKRVSA